ncbi:alcohol dehydrogenase, partial [Pseudoalteromonas ruthenica]
MFFLYRLYHFILKCIVIFIGIPNPQLHKNKSGLTNAIKALQLTEQSYVLLITDRTLQELGIPTSIISEVQRQKLNVM